MWWMEVVVGFVAIVVVVVFCLDHKPADALDSLGAWMFSATVRRLWVVLVMWGKGRGRAGLDG